MSDRKLRILQVSMRDRLGGAERVAWDLLRAYRRLGHAAWLAVGQKKTDDESVFVLPNHRTGAGWSRFWWGVHYRLQPGYGRFPGVRSLCRCTHRLAEPGGLLDRIRGREDFRYPGTWGLLEATPERPNVVHCQNLHSNYFDLRALAWLSKQVPVVLTLQDTWLFSGHCAYSLGCDRWQTGCGSCPDLTIHPAVRRDATAENWQRKRDIFARSRVYVAAPSPWVMEQMRASMLASSVIEARLIPNGVDLSVFAPGHRPAARKDLNLPQDAPILAFAANGIRRNVFKDYSTLREVVKRLANHRLLLLALGEDAPPERVGQAEIRFVPFQTNPRTLVRYYQAADVYVHAARADTCPLVVLEALACGTPVVASAVGGIPYQVRPRHGDRGRFPIAGEVLTQVEDSPTGMLVPPGDAEAMAQAVALLLKAPSLRCRMGENAARDAKARFGLDRQAAAYTDWFHEIVGRQGAPGHVRADVGDPHPYAAEEPNLLTSTFDSAPLKALPQSA